MIQPVDLIEVDIIRAEPAQAVVDLREDRLTRQPYAVWARPHREEYFRGKHDLVALGEVLDRAAQHLLGAALRIHVGRVEEVDPHLQRLADQRPPLFLIERPAAMALCWIAIGHAA